MQFTSAIRSRDHWKFRTNSKSTIFVEWHKRLYVIPEKCAIWDLHTFIDHLYCELQVAIWRAIWTPSCVSGPSHWRTYLHGVKYLQPPPSTKFANLPIWICRRWRKLYLPRTRCRVLEKLGPSFNLGRTQILSMVCIHGVYPRETFMSFLHTLCKK